MGPVLNAGEDCYLASCMVACADSIPDRYTFLPSTSNMLFLDACQSCDCMQVRCHVAVTGIVRQFCDGPSEPVSSPAGIKMLP